MKVELIKESRSIEWHRRVYLSLKAGMPSRSLAKNMNVDYRTINKSYIDYFNVFNNEDGTISLGNKSEPYFSESEMLNGFSVSIHELSKTELEIYNNRT